MVTRRIMGYVIVMLQLATVGMVNTVGRGCMGRVPSVDLNRHHILHNAGMSTGCGTSIACAKDLGTCMRAVLYVRCMTSRSKDLNERQGSSAQIR